MTLSLYWACVGCEYRLGSLCQYLLPELPMGNYVQRTHSVWFSFAIWDNIILRYRIIYIKGFIRWPPVQNMIVFIFVKWFSLKYPRLIILDGVVGSIILSQCDIASTLVFDRFYIGWVHCVNIYYQDYPWVIMYSAPIQCDFSLLFGIILFSGIVSYILKGLVGDLPSGIWLCLYLWNDFHYSIPDWSSLMVLLVPLF